LSDSGSYDDDLPWLQEVEDEDGPRGVSATKMLAALVVVVLAAAIVAASFFWIGRRQAVETGAPELIRAPSTPYKVKPQDPGGLDIGAESETTFETSAGEEVNGRLATGKLGAPPITTPTPEAPDASTEAPKAAPLKPVEPQPAAPAASGGSVVQLGAYRNSAQAERAWLALASRFPQLSNANKMVVPYPGGYRLRASASSPADAKALCSALQAGGESCFIAR
jgi:hypothetical protein